jgi:hypothetical protein
MFYAPVGRVVRVVLTLVVALAATALAADPKSDAYPVRPVTYSTLPAAAEGKFPVALPEDQGIDQVMVLSNRWVVVAVVNLGEVLDKINELSDGKLYKAQDDWDNGLKEGKQNWTS